MSALYSAFTLIFALLFVLCFVYFKGRHFGTLVFVVVATQCLYILTGLIIRSAILLIQNPAPAFSDSLADRRLINVAGNYVDLTTSILGISLIGITLYYFWFFALARYFLNGNSLQMQICKLSTRIDIELIFLILLSLASLALIKSGFISPPVQWLTDLLLPEIGLLILAQSRARSGINKSLPILYLGFSGLCCVIVSILLKSKTPVFYFVLLLVIYFLLKNNFYLTFRYKFSLILLVPFSIAIFNWLQSLKQSVETNQVEALVGQKYFENYSMLYQFIKRMDWIRSITDAFSAGVGSWYNWLDYFELWLKSVQWNYGSSSLVFGQTWSVHVVGKNDSPAATPVSVNYVAEGWLLNGFLGVIFTATIMALLSVFVLRFANNNFFGLFFVFSVIASNAIFENGPIQMLENISKSLKSTIIFFILYTVVRSLRSILPKVQGSSV